jgi:hypothetical protein
VVAIAAILFTLAAVVVAVVFFVLPSRHTTPAPPSRQIVMPEPKVLKLLSG